MEKNIFHHFLGFLWNHKCIYGTWEVCFFVECGIQIGGVIIFYFESWVQNSESENFGFLMAIELLHLIVSQIVD